MAGTSGRVLKDSTVAQISAAIYYQAQVVSKITTNKQFQKKFQSVIFKQIEEDFGPSPDGALLSPSGSVRGGAGVGSGASSVVSGAGGDRPPLPP